jgi:hypothetical protein
MILTFTVDVRPYVFRWQSFTDFYRVTYILRHIIHKSTCKPLLSDDNGDIERLASLRCPSIAMKSNMHIGRSNATMKQLIDKICNANTKNDDYKVNDKRDDSVKLDKNVQESHRRGNSAKFSLRRPLIRNNTLNKDSNFDYDRDIERKEKELNQKQAANEMTESPGISAPMEKPTSRNLARRNSMVRVLKPRSTTATYDPPTDIQPPVSDMLKQPSNIDTSTHKAIAFKPRKLSISLSNRHNHAPVIFMTSNTPVSSNIVNKRQPFRALSRALISKPCLNEPGLSGLTSPEVKPKISVSIAQVKESKAVVDSDSEELIL